jgi:catechol 2,3-dioxygenase-like lactoylglutathione lyase family enzyme
MISSGLATVSVSDMDKAIDFYCDVLGLKLAYRFGNDWAQIIAGQGLTIGLHPASEESPAGKKGSITIGLNVSMPLEDVVKSIRNKGATIKGDIIDDQVLKVQYIEDPDGNELYLAELKAQFTQFEGGKWEKESA